MLDHLDNLFQLQRAAFRKNGAPDNVVRIDRLKRALALLTDNEDHIAKAMMSDFGYRSVDQSFFVEVITTAKPIKEAIKRLGKWTKPERRHIDLPFMMAGARAEVRYQPLGVVGCISPWNFPVNLTFSPLASILAAGNSALLKPSEATPASADLIAELVDKYFDVSEVAVVTGGADTASAFTQLPFDHLIYTGGEAVAKKIAKTAADNLTPLTLELGGKSPVILGEGADLKLAADRIMFGKFLNAGQICLAPDYLLVHESELSNVVDALKVAIEKTAPRECGNKDFVSIINDRHASRLRSYLDEARERGVGIISFDWLTGSDAKAQRNLVAPALLINPDDDLSIMQEEIFGPLLPIRTYKHIDEVIEFVTARPSPLALYYFGTNKDEMESVLSRTQSGGVAINDVIMQYTMDDLPFGGVGPSGMGAYHGFEGFKRFSHARAIYHQSSFDIGGMLRPPYGPRFQKVARLLLKHG